jgi:hypothetical protein
MSIASIWIALEEYSIGEMIRNIVQIKLKQGKKIPQHRP